MHYFLGGNRVSGFQVSELQRSPERITLENPGTTVFCTLTMRDLSPFPLHKAIFYLQYSPKLKLKPNNKIYCGFLQWTILLKRELMASSEVNSWPKRSHIICPCLLALLDLAFCSFSLFVLMLNCCLFQIWENSKVRFSFWNKPSILTPC